MVIISQSLKISGRFLPVPATNLQNVIVTFPRFNTFTWSKSREIIRNRSPSLSVHFSQNRNEAFIVRMMHLFCRHMWMATRSTVAIDATKSLVSVTDQKKQRSRRRAKEPGNCYLVAAL